MSLLWLMECKGCITRSNKSSYTSLHTNSIYKQSQNSSTSSLSSVESDMRSCMTTPLPSMNPTSASASISITTNTGACTSASVSMASSTTSVGESLGESISSSLPTCSARPMQCDTGNRPAMYAPTLTARAPPSPTLGFAEDMDDGFILL